MGPVSAGTPGLPSPSRRTRNRRSPPPRWRWRWPRRSAPRPPWSPRWCRPRGCSSTTPTSGVAHIHRRQRPGSWRDVARGGDLLPDVAELRRGQRHLDRAAAGRTGRDGHRAVQDRLVGRLLPIGALQPQREEERRIPGRRHIHVLDESEPRGRRAPDHTRRARSRAPARRGCRSSVAWSVTGTVPANSSGSAAAKVNVALPDRSTVPDCQVIGCADEVAQGDIRRCPASAPVSASGCVEVVTSLISRRRVARRCHRHRRGGGRGRGARDGGSRVGVQIGGGCRCPRR